MKIACLHSAHSNIAVFEAAARQLGLADGTLLHEVQPQWLALAEQAGGLTADIEYGVRTALLQLAQQADAVMLTCSTLGPAVPGAAQASAVPLLRVDAALAAQAVEHGGRVLALCAVETTLQPTLTLFSAAASGSGIEVEVRLVPDAWALFKAGDGEGYLEAIADAASAAYAEGFSLVVLAQASMAGASERVSNGPPPLSSPVAGLARAVAELSRQR
ncbi:aspartate/glutamate racemase family protein [Pseudomonas sp. QD4]|uniref:aspartate/glutamate racemase family protein n=1 Tax=Pseudomonas sp. QD4 TaxID=3368618 RepID=UPI003B9F396F